MAAAILPVSNWYLPDIRETNFSGVNGEAPIRLNMNENPYGPSEAARKAIIDSLVDANRYPRNNTAKLREEIAKREGLTPDHVMLTAGSTELLGLTSRVYGLEKGNLVACNPDLSPKIRTLPLVRFPNLNILKNDQKEVYSQVQNPGSPGGSKGTHDDSRACPKV